MTWVIIPDTQVPDQDKKAIDSLCAFIEWFQPEGLAHVGDEADQPEPSRWNKGYAGEFSNTLQAGLDETHLMLAQFRDAAPEAAFLLSRSNHGERIRTYLSRYAPALGGLRVLEYERLLGLEELDITYVDRPTEFTKGWLLCHGDEGSLSQASGGTALGLAKKFGKSVVAGHTHRAGLQHFNTAYAGKTSGVLHGMEVGHLMRLDRASYLKGGGANWQQAFGIIDDTGKTPVPILVPIFNSRVQWMGKTF
jgi:hypothetical protein